MRPWGRSCLRFIYGNVATQRWKKGFPYRLIHCVGWLTWLDGFPSRSLCDAQLVRSVSVFFFRMTNVNHSIRIVILIISRNSSICTCNYFVNRLRVLNWTSTEILTAIEYTVLWVMTISLVLSTINSCLVTLAIFYYIKKL